MSEVKIKQEEADVQAVMADLINKVAQDHMDEKYEEALNEVAQSVDNYVNIVNDTSAKQYDEFN